MFLMSIFADAVVCRAVKVLICRAGSACLVIGFGVDLSLQNYSQSATGTRPFCADG
jgi:hypothetical protein